MKEMKLYPDRNNMTEYKMPSSVEEAYDLKKRNNIIKLYLSDNLKIVWYNLARNCKKLEYVRIVKIQLIFGQRLFMLIKN